MIVLLLACFLIFPFASAPAERVWNPVNEENADDLALSLFCQCAFHPEYGDSGSSGRLVRWKDEITVWLGGSFTREDRETLDAFLQQLREKVPGLPSIRRVQQDTQAAVRIWFVPSHSLSYYVEGYVEGNWGFFHYDAPGSVISSARIGIASDITEQEERNHLMLEELVGALGLPGDHLVYADSILYDPWSETQELSDVDWRMLNLLYSPRLSPGMTEEEARAALT